MSPFSITDCFNSPGAHFVGTLGSEDNASIISSIQVFPFLPSGGLDLRPSVLFPKLGVVPGEESLPSPITSFTVAQHDKRAVQVRAVLTVLGEPMHHCWSDRADCFPSCLPSFSGFIQDLQWVDQILLTLQGQIDSLATIMLQNL